MTNKPNESEVREAVKTISRDNSSHDNSDSSLQQEAMEAVKTLILWAGDGREEQQPLALSLQRVLALVSQVEQQDAVLAERRLKALGAG